VIDAPLAYAFTAGLVAAVNPCGFPMLPAYLSWFIGTDEEEVAATSRVPRALASGLTVSLGFLVVFAALGVPINAGVSSIYRAMPWFTIVIGVVLLGLGLAMLAGRQLKVVLPRLDRGGRARTGWSMFVFGVSYAIASLSCTLPVFLVVVAGTTERSNFVSGFLAFLAYGVGMSLVLLVLSLALALAHESMVRWMRAALQYVDRVAGALLVVVGAYLVNYGIYAIRTDDTSSPGVSFVESWSTSLSAWLESHDTLLGWTFALLVVAAAGWAVTRRN
jgi:cytochrome c-type biogenesis protein